MTQPDKLLRRGARDIWDDLSERIDLSGGYETFIDPRAIEYLLNERDKLLAVLNYIAVGENATVAELIAQYDHYRNKESEDKSLLSKFEEAVRKPVPDFGKEQQAKT
jgi:hypothetical protein